MKKQLIGAFLLLASVAYAQETPNAATNLYEAVRAGAATYDHIATIGEYQYEIYVDRSTMPVTIAYRQTRDSLARMAKTHRKDIVPIAVKQKRLAAAYVERLRAELSGTEYHEPETEPEPAAAKRAGPRKDSNQPEDVYRCVKFFPEEDRNQMFVMGVSLNTVLIDFAGRPLASAIFIPGTPIPGVRDEYCQSKVNKWGKPGDHAGHMVGNQLGGWGGRANLTPQDPTLNVTSQLAIENAVAFCAVEGNKPNYNVLANYMTALARPDGYSITLTIQMPTIPPQPVTGNISLINHQPTLKEVDVAEMWASDFEYLCSLHCLGPTCGKS